MFGGCGFRAIVGEVESLLRKRVDCIGDRRVSAIGPSSFEGSLCLCCGRHEAVRGTDRRLTR